MPANINNWATWGSVRKPVNLGDEIGCTFLNIRRFKPNSLTVLGKLHIPGGTGNHFGWDVLAISCHFAYLLSLNFSSISWAKNNCIKTRQQQGPLLLLSHSFQTMRVCTTSRSERWITTLSIRHRKKIFSVGVERSSEISEKDIYHIKKADLRSLLTSCYSSFWAGRCTDRLFGKEVRQQQ